MAIITDDGKVIIEMALDSDFVQCLKEVQDRYGEDMVRVNTLHNDNLNFSTFIDNFVESDSINDATSEPNANMASKDICALEANMAKPNNKLLSYNKIFYELRKWYGLDTARKWLYSEWSGANYLHDASSATYKPYCYAYDLDKIVQQGLFFIDRFKTKPAQHLSTFNDHILESISWLCNRSSGAVGLTSYLVYSWYFWNKDCNALHVLKNPDYYRRQCFQKFIYDLNQPYLRISEPAFTNVSIMDRCYLTELFGGRIFPDGSFAIDHIEEILEHQKVFMEEVSKAREDDPVKTFPVLTYSLLFQNGKFVDEETARWCSDHNTEWNDSNFYNGDTVTSLSNCCFGADQLMTIKVGGKVYNGPFKRLYQTFHHRSDVHVFLDGEWLKATLTAFEEDTPMYHIVTKDGRSMTTTYDHIHLVGDTEVKTYELEQGMALKINTSAADKIGFNSDGYDVINSIERVEYSDKWVFCVEVEDRTRPYFTLANGIVTHNCRLISQTEKLDAFINSIGGTALSVGSIKVNTINLRRIALDCDGTVDSYLEILKDRIDTTLKALDVVRKIISRNIEKGLLPNYTSGMIEISKQYNTIGITAMYEVLVEFGLISTDELGYRSYSDEAMEVACKIMNTINETKDSYDFDYSINVECIPAERANVVLAAKDAIVYPDATEYDLYSNQWIPLSEKCTIHEKVRLGAILDKQCGGGQISHINIDGPFTNKDQAWEMLNYIASQGVIYFAFNAVISSCPNLHNFYGEVCPKCGEAANQHYTRVVGFLTPVEGWSKERRAEFKKRTWIEISKMRGITVCE